MDKISHKLDLFIKLIEDNDWQTIEQTPHIVTQRRFTEENNNLACYRSYGHVKRNFKDLANYVLSLYDNHENARKFDNDISEYAVIASVDDHTRICRQVNSLPWPIWSRESLYLQTCKAYDESAYIIMYSIDHDNVPEQTDKYVRSNIIISGYAFISVPDGTIVHRLAQIHPGGYIPTSILNNYSSKCKIVIDHLQNHDISQEKID